MKIGDLDQHCGNCGVIDFCGNPFGYCLCRNKGFDDIEEDAYSEIAEKATGLKNLKVCEGCARPDCGIYRYSNEDFADEECEHMDEARDFLCEQIADYVRKQLVENNAG